MVYSYEYPAHYVTVDSVIFGVASVRGPTRDTYDLQILLIERGDPAQPFHGHWALPGGFVRPKEALEAAVARELEEETGVRSAFLDQLYTFGAPDRDPRGRVISVAYMALVHLPACALQAGTDAARARWCSAGKLPSLAFDHPKMVALALDRLRDTIRSKPMVFSLLPPKFTIAQVQAACEAVLGRQMDVANFRKALLRMEVLKEAGEETQVSHRPAKLFRFDEKAYARFVKKGGRFEI
jgi:8-oxo-dGTP diphosphatase